MGCVASGRGAALSIRSPVKLRRVVWRLETLLDRAWNLVSSLKSQVSALLLIRQRHAINRRALDGNIFRRRLGAVSFQGQAICSLARWQAEHEFARLAGHARVELLHRLFVDHPHEINSHSGNAATRFRENAAANERNRAFIDGQKKMIA